MSIRFFSPQKDDKGEKHRKIEEKNPFLAQDDKTFTEESPKIRGKYSQDMQNFCKIKGGNLHGKFKTSASELNTYAICPHKWLFERIYKIDDYSTEMADLIEPKDDGSFKHLIIDHFLKNLRCEENGFRKIREIPDRERKLAVENALNQAFSQLETYKTQENEYKNRRDTFYRQNPDGEFTEERPQNNEIFKTINEVEMILSQRREYEIFATRFSEVFLKTYGDFSVFSSEMSFGNNCDNDFCQIGNEDIFINGRIDCVLLLDENVFGIIDFKRGEAPAAKSCLVENDELPTNFQMTAYDELITKNYDSSRVALIDFFPLKKFKNQRVMSAEPEKSKKEEEFLNAKEIFRLFARQFKNDVENGDFTASSEYPIEQKNCQNCSFKYICRTCYSLATEMPPNNDDKSFLGKLNFQKGGENG